MRQQILLNKSRRTLFVLIAVLLLSANSIAFAQTSTFTYQGRLTDGGTPATAVYDLQFALFDSSSAGSQIGSTQTTANVSVNAGLFTVPLDFGAAALTGANRFLEIGVRLAGSGAFTTLSSRQQITSTPYAVRSANASLADSATNAAQLGGQPASQYVLTGDARLGDARSPSAGSSNYVQNTTSPQPSTNFNISGNGTLATLTATGAINTATQYNIGGNRVLSVTGGSEANSNTFGGVGAGAANLPNAGGGTAGNRNSFFGFDAGNSNTLAYGNSLFGYQAGALNTIASENSFFGQAAGYNNTQGRDNVFFGSGTGYSNTIGNFNTFIGNGAGNYNVTGDYNTALGFGASASPGAGASNLNHATAIGAEAGVTTSNTIVLGRADGSDFVVVPGFLTIPNLAVAGSTQLCRNSFNRVGTCSSSLRYKTNLAPYRSGLNVVNRLRPISFTWKEGGLRDLGFGAEDVEQIDPLLVTYNKEGQVEGVKYDRINVVLVNALKEQQQQIASQQRQLDAEQRQNYEQRRQIESLKRLVCLSHSKAAICK